MAELNPLTLGDVPEDFIENDDGSVTIPDMDDVVPESDFLANLAESLDEKELSALASGFLEAVERDKEARKKRDEQQAEGLRRTGLGNDAPGGAEFEGASKVVHPVMAEVCVDFAASAMKELFPPSGPVKTTIANQKKGDIKRAERLRDFFNWQLTKQIKSYRDEQEQLVTQLPMGGSQYQKFWYDSRLKRPDTEFIPVDKLILPFEATSLYTASRVTHLVSINKLEFDRRVESGLYREIELLNPESIEKTTSELANEKIEGKDGEAYDEDGLRHLYEIYCYAEVGDDDIAPYIVTIDVFSEKVLAIYRNWDENDEAREKLDWIVEYKFIPWRGAYAIGLPHLIGGLSGALTGALRALLDSAHIANSPTLLKLKGGRLVGQTKSIDVTQVQEIDAPPGTTDIRQVVMGMPFPGPSPVLFQLLGFLDQAAKGVASTAEEKIADASNQMPVGTALALIEQGSKVFSQIHARLHRSQEKALQILSRINRTYGVDVEAVKMLGGPELVPEDFQGIDDVSPASDPNIFSEAQRFAQMQGVEQLAMSAPQLPWNQHALKRRMLDLMHVPDPDEILPPAPEPVTADPLAEIAAVLEGKPLKADLEQDHLSHIQGHLGYVLDPIQGAVAPFPALQILLNNVNEHLTFLYQKMVTGMAPVVAQQLLAQGQQPTPDTVAVMAQQQVSANLGQKLQPLMQLYAQAQQVIQKRMPPPQMPPEVQASLQIAQMDSQRKSQEFQGTMQLRQQELQMKQQSDAQQAMMDNQFEQVRMALEQSQQQFDQQMAMMKQQSDDRVAQLQQQIELMKNEQDNHQHQMTELLKNRDDNETAILIAQMKEEMGQMQDMMANPVGPDMSQPLAEMNRMLGEIQRAKTEDALAAVVDGLRVAISEITRPRTRTLVRDPVTNRPVGSVEG